MLLSVLILIIMPCAAVSISGVSSGGVDRDSTETATGTATGDQDGGEGQGAGADRNAMQNAARRFS